jgi:mannose-1-phosphate guanylyltransferase
VRAQILAAGLGTRLRPLTDELPKPLVPVGDRPVLAHIAARLAAASVREVVLNTHHLAGAFTPGILASLPVDLHVVHEPEILGTGGALANAAALLGEGDVLVWNGDILAGVDAGALAAAHRSAGAAATLVVAPRALGEGTVGITAGGTVARLRGERFGEEVASGDFLGIHVVGAEIRRMLPRRGCVIDAGYRPALRRGMLVATFSFAGPWDDIGTVAAYLAANARWLAERGGESFVHPSARVAPGVEMKDSIVGAGAVVSGTGVVEGSVLWPGCQAEAPLVRAVVTPGSAAHRG